MMDQNEQLVDELLVMECQDGSVQAMDLLVRRWQKRLWRYAYRLTGDPEAAWEVTQESWLGIIRGLGRLDDPARFRPWVYRIVTRRAHDWIGRNIQARQRCAESAVREIQAAPAQSQEDADDLQDMVGRLPDQSRTVLTLHYLEGLPLTEMARVLDIPEGTVKSRLHSARNELKTLWQQASR
jgi:RNA polymerase sigma-70 factor (ECF subfamily)